MLFPNLEKKDTNIIFTYTPMHGVGYPYIKNVFENAKFNVSINTSTIYYTRERKTIIICYKFII